MSLPIDVDAYAGYKTNERPRQFDVDEETFQIAAVEDRWYEPDAEYFRVRTTEGKRYILRYDEHADEWTLQSGFDGAELFARPSIELVTVDPQAIRKAERAITSCERCRPDEADHLFDSILANVLDKHGPHEFILTTTAQCPNCKTTLTEKTLITPQGGIQVKTLA